MPAENGKQCHPRWHSTVGSLLLASQQSLPYPPTTRLEQIRGKSQHPKNILTTIDTPIIYLETKVTLVYIFVCL